MLEVHALNAAYGQHPSLNDVSINVAKGEIVVILGANGAGKSTLLRAIAGICEGRVTGDVRLDGQSLSGLTSDQIVEAGVALVPEGRGIFGDLSVRENLVLGAYSKRARADEAANLERVMDLFPKLAERQTQIARTMSGGEQQMVAIGRAMMSNPDILMLDEPSLGLSPLLCKELFQNLAHVKDLGIGVLLVEQNAKQSLAIADRGYLLENTRVTHEDSAAQLATDPAVQKAYLGAGGKAGAKPSTSAAVPSVRPPPLPPAIEPRRTAEQQIGIDIEGLVQTASTVSAGAARSAPQVSNAQVDHVVQSRIGTVLKDIERAAKEARRRPSAAKPSTATVPRTLSSQEADTPPPVIEIYRRPRVEVYRRQPDGKFDRN